MFRTSLVSLHRLIIVESPTKIEKIKSVLSSVTDWSFGEARLSKLCKVKVVPEIIYCCATGGHFLETTEILLEGCNDGNNKSYSFSPKYSMKQEKCAKFDEIVELSKLVDEIIIASDPDREGELIAKHVATTLKERRGKGRLAAMSRAYFQSITEDGILRGVKNRDLRPYDESLALAAETRHMMDRIFGFFASRVVSSFNPLLASVGRVQTPALILIRDREAKIEKVMNDHVPTVLFNLKLSLLESLPPKNLTAPVTGALAELSLEDAQTMIASWKLESTKIHVKSLPTSAESLHVAPKPHTLQTLLLEAGRRFNMRVDKVTELLQDLYQRGLTTYPRTDSTRMDATFVPSIAARGGEGFGKQDLDHTRVAQASHFVVEAIVPSESSPAEGKKKEKKGKKVVKPKGSAPQKVGNVEDAHEALRPTVMTLLPDKLPDFPAGLRCIYRLIYDATVASVMIDRRVSTATVVLEVSPVEGVSFCVTVSSSKDVEEGWRKAGRSTDTNQEADEAPLDVSSSHDVILSFAKGVDSVQVLSLTATLKSVSTPSLYSEGTLIQELKRHDIGRPSTYQKILSTLFQRGYVTMDSKGKVHTTPLGKEGAERSRQMFARFVDVQFSGMFEKTLDSTSKLHPKIARIHSDESLNVLVQQLLDDMNSALLDGLIRSRALRDNVDVKTVRTDMTKVFLSYTLSSKSTSFERKMSGVREFLSSHTVFLGGHTPERKKI